MDVSALEFSQPQIDVSQVDTSHISADGTTDGDFDAAVELDERLLNFPASGMDGLSGGNAASSSQFYNRMGPKKAFSVMKYKKKLKKDTSLLFDEKPQASQLASDAFDFFKVEDVTNCATLLQQVTGQHEDGDESGN